MLIAIRRAGPADAPGVTALFHMMYRNSSHPFQTEGGVSEFLSQPRNFQIVAEEAGRIVASMAMTYSAWNDAYELGRALTHPDYRRHGLALSLIQQVVDWVSEAGLGEAIFGFPRVRRIVELCSLLQPRMIVAGHDAGRNVANGRRETHLIVYGIPKHSRFTHRAPPIPKLREWAFLREEIYGALKLDSSLGSYPITCFTGEVQRHARALGGWIVNFEQASGSLEIVGYDGTLRGGPLAEALQSLLASMPGIQHVTATLLADKIEVVRQLADFGFGLSAYLPAWYKLGESRYDCVQLTLQLYADVPAVQDFGDIVTRLAENLACNPYLQTHRLLEKSSGTYA